MCRILTVRSEHVFEMDQYLADFAEMCESSKEYQGHGWGMAWQVDGHWQVHKSLTPIWEDDLTGFGQTPFLLVHARSAFRNEGIAIENNMPFHDQSRYFIFNGELQGVRIKESGRIGAEKIFNYIRRFDKGCLDTAFRKATNIIRKRTEYVRGMNILMTDGHNIYACNHYGEDPDYFTLYHRKDRRETAFCSQPLGSGWSPLTNGQTMVA